MTHRKTVLVVDDIPLMRTILSRYVKIAGGRLLEEQGGATGVDVIEAGTAQQALDRIRREQVDLIFMDLMMPGMDGMAFLEQRQKDPELSSIPVVVCSALGGPDTVERALSLGASEYLLKPYTLSTVDEKIRAALYALQD